MKQLIVLIATIVLGVVIAGYIIGFGGTAEKLQNAANNSISSVFTSAGITK